MAAYKVSIVNYLNSAPFVHGLTGRREPRSLGIDIQLDHPAESARKLLHGEVDIALAPVAIMSQMEDPHVVSDYCIGCDGAVKTVQLFSEQPVDRISRIYLDYQSETSVRLTRILCRDHWKIEPEFVRAYPGYQKDIYGDHAGLIIGDRAIRVLGKYPVETDLGAAWKTWTGKPFVFAVWMAREPVDPDWMKGFNAALRSGLDDIGSVIHRYSHLDTPHFSVRDYLTQYIDFDLDANKRDAMKDYLALVGTL